MSGLFCSDCGNETRSFSLDSQFGIIPVEVCVECGLIHEKRKSGLVLFPLAIEKKKCYQEGNKVKCY